jgi:hypothetical protein
MGMAQKRIAALEEHISRKIDGPIDSVDRIPQKQQKKVTGRRIYCGFKNPNATLV